MRIVKPDKAIKEREQILRNSQAEFEVKKKEYIDSLKKNRKFQVYILDGILRKHIDEVSNLDNIKPGDFEEMGKLAFEAIAIKKQLESILSELVN